jgi:hypothetical protein
MTSADFSFSSQWPWRSRGVDFDLGKAAPPRADSGPGKRNVLCLSPMKITSYSFMWLSLSTFYVQLA